MSHGEVGQMVRALETERRAFITQAFRTVFPVEVEPLSKEDAGEEGVQVECSTTA